MSRHKVQKSSFGNNAAPKKSSFLKQATSWTNPYEQSNDQGSEQPTNTVKPPTTEEWLKDNIMLKTIETRQAQLQRQQLEENSGTEPQPESIQAKLTVGEPGDKYEQEADMMASRVMSMPDNAVQRQMTPEQEVQTKPVVKAVVTRLPQGRDWNHLWHTLGSYNPVGPKVERDKAAQQWQAWLIQL
ncbi:HEAT repeat-containing PBS lyase [Cylindrospermum sp. NIES-4074]|nr:HEAT repeat-containing PBS lyase [Cylindrospermum sp. NIES-4074]